MAAHWFFPVATHGTAVKKTHWPESILHIHRHTKKGKKKENDCKSFYRRLFGHGLLVVSKEEREESRKELIPSLFAV